jgi:UDP-N-acetylglucosamine 2-epimerase (non-hydrolysing)
MASRAMKVLFFFGTRPEAIKLAPVLQELRGVRRIKPVVCVSAQHRELLDGVLSAFNIVPDYDLDLMLPEQSLFQITRSILERIEPVLERERPDLIVVQGDAQTAFVGALAGYYQRIPVAHVEAGLRTHDKYAPFPEEMNRSLIDRIAELRFATTTEAQQNLLDEGILEQSVFVTGSTEIDALHFALEQDACEESLAVDERLVLVTAHRRESFHGGISRICMALQQLAQRNEGITIVYPVHPNPNVRRTVEAELAGRERILLVDPMNYVPFVHLLARSTLILTDSGGVQEAATALHVPLLVLRDKTERVEGLRTGAARLVGTDPERIVAEAERLLHDPAARAAMVHAENPYGDGHAATRILKIIEARFL